MVLCVAQLSAKKRFVYGAIAFIWIVIPTLEITFTAVTTDIVKGMCVEFGVYQSYAMRKSFGFFTIFFGYFLPLSLLTFCYARIVHALRTKVNLFCCYNRNSNIVSKFTDIGAITATNIHM